VTKHGLGRKPAGTVETPGNGWRSRTGEGFERAWCKTFFLDVERTIMKRIRSKRQRAAGFEVLEGRWALSAGLAVASHHAEAVARTHSQHRIPVSISGQLSVAGGTAATVTGVTGTIGKADFTSGSGSGTVSSNQFQGGTIDVSNGQGTIELSLGAARIVTVGGHQRMKVKVVAVSAGGAYAQVIGSAGTLTATAPIGFQGVSRFSGSLHSSGASAGSELGG
jgi:hypothetical protein